MAELGGSESMGENEPEATVETDNFICSICLLVWQEVKGGHDRRCPRCGVVPPQKRKADGV